MALRSPVIQGYRRLLRARLVAFQGDTLALNKSQEAIRQAFVEHRCETDGEKIRDLLRGVDQAEEMLKFHILQGKLNEQGNYSVPIPKEKAERMAGHQLVTPLDEESIPAEPKPVVVTHSPRKSETPP
mmetsp:Transcript_35318/g.79685  ORF Transcript_35318/g.79685 Transcript_35318/m.79685 type:complete len:128 (-) Transcript_35318:189-572(-)